MRHKIVLESFFFGVEVVAKSLQAATEMARILPGGDWACGKALDIVFGPAEEFDYVSNTAPVGSPPSE